MIERAPHRFWRSAAVTHPGRERAENQDRFLALPSLGLFLVADGMGGPPGNEVACAIVEMANHRGGPDNITAVFVRAEERL